AEVSLASQQQAQGIEQVTRAIALMEKLTQTTAAAAQQSAAASDELNAQAEAAMNVVGRLETLMGSRNAEARPAFSETIDRSAAAPSTPVATQKSLTTMTKSAEDILPLGDTGTYGTF